jgi:hypothetical protein
MGAIVVAAWISALFGLIMPIRQVVSQENNPPPTNTEVTPEEVRLAIDRGIGFLKSQQRPDGTWAEPVADQAGGVTALCTLALLNAGVEPGEPSMQKALGAIRKIPPERTYVTSLVTMVLARAEPTKDLPLIQRNVRWLESKQITEGLFKGSWAYPTGSGDNSNAQFALLALHEAERAGVAVNDRTWRLAKDYWEADQNDDGSWTYAHKVRPPLKPPENTGTGSMTCAGITSLVIVANRVQACDAKVNGSQIDCCGSQRNNDSDRIEKAMGWLEKRFTVRANPGQNVFPLYYLYGLERVGRLTAHRFIGGHDWYREGTDWLVRHQDSLSYFWKGVGPGEQNELIGTSFALLFLSKGRWPVLLGKVKYSNDNDWNRHRSDVNNLTRYTETRWKRDLTWQIVDIQRSSVEDLLQTPVLYLCGSKSPLPKEEIQSQALAKKIRDYLDRGGFLFAEAYCGEAGFDKGFQQLLKMVFPEPEYKLRLLEADHPIWYAEEKVAPQQLRPLYGVEFGCRTSVVYAPLDPADSPRPSLSCLWELSRPERGEKFNPTVQAKVGAAMSTGLNILAYATNRELKTKDSFFRSKSAALGNDKLERGRLAVAKLRHPGGCNAAPRALVNLMEAAGREMKLRVHVRDELLDLTDPSLFDYPLVFMHGRTAFRLTPTEQQQLKLYIERGGVLLADSICASPAFTESFHHEMETIFPNQKMQRIPVDDPLLSEAYGGFDLKTVSRRDPATRGTNDAGPLKATVAKVPPDLEGLKFQDRWGVIFSQYDLSCALEKRDSLDCRGYVREDAAKIGINVLLYTMQQ